MSSRSELHAFFTALQYFTRVPAPAWVGHEAAHLQHAARYFPAIGLLLGVAGAIALYAVAQILPPPLPALLSTAITAGLTGALHEDGLADTFDGLGGGATRERALAIMKDSRVGTYGVVALLLTIAIKVAALGALPAWLACVALICMHAWSRWCALVLIWRLPYVGSSEQSRAQPVVAGMTGSRLLFAATFGLFAPLLLAAATAQSRAAQSIETNVAAACIGVIVGACLLTLWLLGRWYKRRVGGYTGDTLGATQQLIEVVGYLGLLAVWTSF